MAIIRKGRPKSIRPGTALLAGALLGLPVAAFAQQPAPPGGVAGGSGIAGLLSGTAVSDRDLGQQAARGLATDMYAVVEGNANLAGGGGTISNVGSINNNTGITTIFQNTGNNSLFQSQTVVNVSIR